MDTHVHALIELLYVIVYGHMMAITIENASWELSL